MSMQYEVVRRGDSYQARERDNDEAVGPWRDDLGLAFRDAVREQHKYDVMSMSYKVAWQYWDEALSDIPDWVEQIREQPTLLREVSA